ncbi:MAG: NADP-dependent 3-hydroxy acid dehydrogenase YdfG [Bacteroidia bacterium]|nr:NADP-dependent 3-hydroxy acid dehydrogenase YdfG [Bacteroidia bacterium]
MANKTILITGATSGIGEAAAHIFSANKYNLVITGRRKERLEKLAEELSKQNVEVLTLCFDVRNNDEVERNISSLQGNWKNIDVLINNAGLASGLGPIQNGELDDWEKMIDTNIKGLLYVTRAVSPLMIARNSGHIINIASLAGKDVYPNGNVYCATKHAVDALSRSMRIDLLPHGIKVTNIAPGLVETEFSIVRFHGDKERADNVYKGFQPLTAADIADAIWYAASRPAHFCVNDMVLTPLAQANAYVVNKK